MPPRCSGAGALDFGEYDGSADFIGRPYDHRIGPTRVRGKYDAVPLSGYPRTASLEVMWSESDTYDHARFGAQMLAGPYALPDPVVRFHLRAPGDGESDTVLPLAPRDTWWLASTIRKIGARRVIFAFAPQFKQTVASAAAGAAIASETGARFDGELERVEISHGVLRFARPVVLGRAMRLGPTAASRILVRVRDYGAARGIVDPVQLAAQDDRGDILVRGARRSSDPEYIVYIGADLLGGCSSITYDKPRRRIILRCRPAG